MTKISVFTASHRVTHLLEAWRSLCAQTFPDWEWVLVLNNGAEMDRDLALELDADPRVHVYHRDDQSTSVGYWKRAAVSLCSAPLLAELDHDDILAPNCLEELVAAFEAHPWAVLAYSNTVQVNEAGRPNYEMFDQRNGWLYREVSGKELWPDTETHRTGDVYFESYAMAPTPHNVSLIWFAPNHVRAFRRDAYDRAGGYNAELFILDDQDLMCRLFQQGDFFHVDAPLYLQRVHEHMTQRDAAINSKIQEQTWDFYEMHLQANLLSWSARRGLHALDVGCGNARSEGFIGVDIAEGDSVDVVAKLPDLSMFEDNSVGVIRMTDVLEHIPAADVIASMGELHRVLAPGGMLLSLTPSTDGRGAFQDPTHVSFWNQNSWWYYTDDSFRSHSPQIESSAARFQVSRLRTLFPSEWHEQHNISYVQANVIAIKSSDDDRNGGFLWVTPPNQE